MKNIFVSVKDNKNLKKLSRRVNFRRSSRQVLTFFLMIALVVSCVMLYLSDRVIEPDLKMRKGLPDRNLRWSIWEAMRRRFNDKNFPEDTHEC